MPKPYYGGRSLLNKPGFHSTGAVAAEIEDTSGWKPGKNRDGEAATRYNIEPFYVFQVSDCSRTTTFDLNFSEDPESLENNLFKLDALIDAFTAMREGVTTENERYKQRLAAIEKAKKKKRKKKKT